MFDVVVFSHLRWDFVFQRPQHLLSRLAGSGVAARIWFVEEPVHSAGEPHVERWSPCEGVTVLRARTPVEAPGFHDDQLPALTALLQETFAAENVNEPVVWFYTPMALPLLDMLQARAVVYDCMDELSAFDFAPRQLQQREAALLSLADLVLTGGPSLYEAKKPLHANVHCFPSAVDALHFAPHARPLLDSPLQADIAPPRLGFFGVIDERLDLALIGALAAAEPGWQIVMVGPVVKIDPATLPRADNVHWLGQQPYASLPALVSGWDVCLLPFALNAATRFISPTKTLEYMAADKPVVSTAVRDVAALYGDQVAIAQDAAEFIELCRVALREDAEQRLTRVAEMRACVARYSWDRTAQAIGSLIEDAVARRSGGMPKRGRHAMRGTDDVVPVQRAPRHVDQIVIGAGPTGLAAAYYLGQQRPASSTMLIESEAEVGGWCRSIVDKGFTFDHAGHIMFSNDPEVLRLYGLLLGDNLHWQNREAWVYSHGVHTRYPFQGALYGLPPKVLKECLMGAIEARDGAESAGPPANFEQFIYRVWGKGVAKHFAIPYNQKLWAVPLNEMETSWLGGRVPLPDLEQMIEGALEPAPAPMGPNARFGYPLRGGFQALMDGFLPLIDAEMAMNTRVVSVVPRERLVRTSDGRTLHYGTLVSTMPLTHLVAACGDEAPAEIHAAAAGLRHVSVRCVNLGVAREAITDKHWIYYPEDTVFHRIFVQGNASPHNNPAGGFGLTCEITYAPGKPLPCEGQALIDLCVADARRVGLLREDDHLLAANQVDMPCAYVVYDHARAANVERIRAWLASHGIVLAGRYSEWEYYNSDHAFMAGRRAAQACADAGGDEPLAARAALSAVA
jgi:protoporphyrinogen oxidase/glycosyltransferase involved in cell wall biosynthesis